MLVPTLIVAALAASTSASNPKFAALAETFIHESLILAPTRASQAGYHQHAVHGKMVALDAELEDVSPAGIAKLKEFYQQWEQKLTHELGGEHLSAEDGVDLRLLQSQIGLALLELNELQGFRYNPAGYVELLGDALFEPLSVEYAPKAARLGHILARMRQIPRFLDQARAELKDSDPIFVQVAIEENAGNVDLIEHTIAPEIPNGPLKTTYGQVGPRAIHALRAFSAWLEKDLGKRPSSRTWRLGEASYEKKFKLVMGASVVRDQVLRDAERQLQAGRAEMLTLALPLHKDMYPGHSDHAGLSQMERENTVVGEVLQKLADHHARRGELLPAVEGDLEEIKTFIREKQIASLSPRENLKVTPTPAYLRGGIMSVAGFHAPPPLDPKAEAQFWVTPIEPSVPETKAESKLREYNQRVLQWLVIHEALPGHYIQFEHANDVQPLTRRLIRTLYGSGPYIEGWAEYIAQVMLRAGFDGGDPGYKLSYLKIWLRSTANAILDIRMQTMGMTDQEALDLMEKQAFQTQAEAEAKLRRAKLSSVQLATYFVGTRQWWGLREAVERTDGKDFNMKAFHDAALDEGAVPVEDLGRLLAAHEGT